MAREQRGLFITFEGGEGSGKSTQARLLHECLTGLGWEVLLTREPGGTPLGEQVRRILLHPESAGMDPLTELCLYLAARREHVISVILPALARGATVIADRFGEATLAYQGYGRGVDRALVRSLHRRVASGIEPDLTFLLDLEADEGLDRARSRHRRLKTGGREGRFELEDDAFHRRVRRGYILEAGRRPERIVIIDGRGTVEDIRRLILDTLRRRFPGRKWRR